jgi:hypothetical protein
MFYVCNAFTGKNYLADYWQNLKNEQMVIDWNHRISTQLRKIVYMIPCKKEES